MELNAEQIIQGLRENDSPYKTDRDNIWDAIALIKQLNEENEAISERCAIQVVTAIELDKQVQRLTEENEDLKAIAEQYQKQFEEAKADTVREMQERLKAYFGTYAFGYKIPLTEALKAVNQIAKEMTDGHST